MAHPGPGRRRPIREWPCWYWSPSGEGKVFDRAEGIPYGWTRRQDEVFVAPPQTPTLDSATLVALLADKGITASPLWSARYMKDMLDK